MAQIEGGVIDALAGGVGPEIECIAGSAAFEAVEGVGTDRLRLTHFGAM